MNKTKWLALATSDDREDLSKIVQDKGYAFAVDGFRMHIAKMDYDEIDFDGIDNAWISKAIKINQEAIVIERFGINPAYLAEAILAWADNASDEPIIIEYCYNKESGANFVRIQNAHYDDPKQAVIMCMRLHLPEEVEPLPEKMQKLNENAKESEGLPTNDQP